jgi:hypothetical protein
MGEGFAASGNCRTAPVVPDNPVQFTYSFNFTANPRLISQLIVDFGTAGGLSNGLAPLSAEFALQALERGVVSTCLCIHVETQLVGFGVIDAVFPNSTDSPSADLKKCGSSYCHGA